MTSNRSFAGDLQEPFRWIADVTVMEAFESGALDLPCFYFTGDDYRYRFEPEARKRLLDMLRERFNSEVKHKGCALKWDTVIEQKVNELGRFLLGKSFEPDFVAPAPRLEGNDDRDLRARILALTSYHAKQLGIGKSTLHHLRRRAKSEKAFRVYASLRSKVSTGKGASLDACGERRIES